MKEVNIRGKRNPYVKKMPFDDVEHLKELNDCFDCKGCLCESFCKELEEEYFGEEGDVCE